MENFKSPIRRRKAHEAAQNTAINILAAPPTAQEVADAIVATKACLVSAEYIDGGSGTPPQPIQGAVFSTPLIGFPTEGNSFAVLSSGDASQAASSTTELSTVTNGPSFPPTSEFGDPAGVATANDVIILRLTFNLPANPGTLSFDWKFATSETNHGLFQDYFRANVTTSAGTTNIARFPGNLVVNTNTMQTVPTQSGPPYEQFTTDLYTASFNLSPFGGETITLDFIVGDASDSIWDSAAFIDNIRISGCVTPVRGIAFDGKY